MRHRQDLQYLVLRLCTSRRGLVKTGRPRLTFFRDKFVELVAAGWTIKAAAKAVRIHRATAYRWSDQMGLPKRSYRKAVKK